MAVVRRVVRRPVPCPSLKEVKLEPEDVSIPDSIESFMQHSVQVMTPEQQERQAAYENSLLYMQRMNRMDISATRMPFPARTLIECAPFTRNRVVEQYELFLMCLLDRFRLVHGPTSVPPAPVELFNMQDTLLEPCHHCFFTKKGEDGGCSFWALGLESTYHSVLLDQTMISTGTVAICKTTGFLHICDDRCRIQNPDQIYVCMVTGITCIEDLRHSAPMPTAEGKPVVSQYRYMGERKRKVAHPKYEAMDREKIGGGDFSEQAAEPLPQVDMMSMIKTEASKLLGPLAPPSETERLSSFRTTRAPARKIKIAVVYSAKEAVEHEEMRYQTSKNFMDIVRTDVMRLSYERLQTNEKLEDKLQRDIIVRYRRWCIRQGIRPSRSYAKILYDDIPLQLHTQTGAKNLQLTERYYQELLMYYWTILAPLVFEGESYIPTAWTDKKACKFAASFLDICIEGLTVQTKTRGNVVVLVRDAFLEGNLKQSTKSRSTKPVHTSFKMSNLIRRIITVRAEDEEFISNIESRVVFERISQYLSNECTSSVVAMDT
jgi:hypothetical protein